MVLLILEILALLAYFYFRAISPLLIAIPWKILAFLGAIFIALKFVVMRLLGGNYFFSSGIPPWFANAYDILFGVFFFFVIFLISCDLFRIVLWILKLCHVNVSWFFRMAWYRSLWFYLPVLFLSLILELRGFYNAVYAPPEIRSVHFHAPQLQSPLRIAVLADLHICERSDLQRIQSIVQRTNALNADVIVVLGDVVDGSPDRIGPLVEPLRDLRARNGVFVVSGNHEYYSGYQVWMSFYRKLGMTVLDNNHTVVADGVHLFGVCDPQGVRLHEPVVPNWEKLEAALKSSTRGEYRILLSHRPYISGHDDFLQNFDLQLSGHTHGGMMPGLKTIVGLFQRNLVSGHYRIGKTDLYVSNGTSLWREFPVRLFAPSEITLVTLER